MACYGLIVETRLRAEERVRVESAQADWARLQNSIREFFYPRRYQEPNPRGKRGMTVYRFTHKICVL